MKILKLKKTTIHQFFKEKRLCMDPSYLSHFGATPLTPDEMQCIGSGDVVNAAGGIIIFIALAFSIGAFCRQNQLSTN